MPRAFNVVVVSVVGAAVGSFLNVVIHRVPLGASIVRPRSACPRCDVPLRAVDNIPVVSWLLLRGRCRSCRTRISSRYVVVELVALLLFGSAAMRFEVVELVAFVAAVSSVLLTVAMIDLEHRRVPNVVVLPATVGALVWVAAAGMVEDQWQMVGWALVSGVGAFGLFLMIAVLSGGMGFGDVKLAAFVGVGCGRFGWETTALAIFVGFVAGGLVAAVMLVSGRSGRKDALPFAPALALGAVVALFAGPGPVRAWLGV